MIEAIGSGENVLSPYARYSQYQAYRKAGGPGGPGSSSAGQPASSVSARSASGNTAAAAGSPADPAAAPAAAAASASRINPAPQTAAANPANLINLTNPANETSQAGPYAMPGQALPPRPAAASNPALPGTAIAGQAAADRPGAAENTASAGDRECKTCESRTYQDGSDDPGVSYKNPTRIGPDQAGSAVRSHEYEHVTRERAKASRENREVISQSVAIKTAICPECGRVYVSGGTTTTVTRAVNNGSILRANGATGALLDTNT